MGGPLTEMQVFILGLEEREWKLAGSKLTAFRARYPNVTQTGYDVALLQALRNPAALEYDNQRYAPLILRLRRLHQARLTRREGLRMDNVLDGL